MKYVLKLHPTTSKYCEAIATLFFVVFFSISCGDNGPTGFSLLY